jgi:hypothetical protein
MAVPQDEFVAHYRVSTGRPGKNGLGLEARRRSGHKFQGRQLAWPTSLKWRAADGQIDQSWTRRGRNCRCCKHRRGDKNNNSNLYPITFLSG